jgi:hypothetical protein
MEGAPATELAHRMPPAMTASYNEQIYETVPDDRDPMLNQNKTPTITYTAMDPNQDYNHTYDNSYNNYKNQNYSHDTGMNEPYSSGPAPQDTEFEMYNRRKGDIPQHYWLRALLSVLGPIVLVLLYVLIITGYLIRPAVNDIKTGWGKSRLVFYGWFVIGVFALDWAKDGIAGAEAAALMRRTLAPRNTRQLMWHTDQSWSGLSGWLKALKVSIRRLMEKRWSRGYTVINMRPGKLWVLLTFHTLLIYVALPLSGLSMDLGDGFTISGDVQITGPSKESFNAILPLIFEDINHSLWASGQTTQYLDTDTIVFAPAGTKNVSTTYWEDSARAIGNQSLSIRAFFGPATDSRAHGSTWGIEAAVSCAISDPYKDLDLINVTNYNTFNLFPPYANRNLFHTIPKQYLNGNDGDGDYIRYQSSFRLLEILSGVSGYNLSVTNASPQIWEVVFWQSSWDAEGFESIQDPDWDALKRAPLVRSSLAKDPTTNKTVEVLGFAVQCSVVPITGTADLDAQLRTYSNFQPVEATKFKTNYASSYTQTNEQIYVASHIAFGNSEDAWLDVNYATRSGITNFTKPGDSSVEVQFYPRVTPERLMLSMYKLLGQSAITAMDKRQGLPWTGELKGLRAIKIIRDGVIPWQFVLSLLCIWAFSSVIATILALPIARRAATLDGYEMFKLGYNTHAPPGDELIGGEYHDNPKLDHLDTKWFTSKR